MERLRVHSLKRGKMNDMVKQTIMNEVDHMLDNCLGLKDEDYEDDEYC